ncbi:alpha/beta hydrolase [Thalassotalea psychrophila]|uniref:Alpha/beta hydrolase n=1 Tax=Thalassotalea psychrophila TaxID=3065647 RepID=A0ABY9TUD7_9GAMM|nr:alpha/beta hydrolase [Colwelliaceae bacterium SQ149]
MTFFYFQEQKIAYHQIESDKQCTRKNDSEIKTLVFLHGLGADHRQFIDTGRKFSGYRILVIDMPGHGETVIDPSEKLEHWFRFETFSNITLALLDHLCIDKATFVGLSMGAGISIQVALKQPTRVESLILIRPAWLNRSATPNLLAIKSIGEDILQGGIEYAEDRLRTQKWFQKLELENPLCTKSIVGLFTRPQATTAAMVLINLVNDSPFQQSASLIKIKQPTIVIGNDEDLFHPINIAEQLSELIPNAHYQQLPSRYQQSEEHHHQLIQLMHLFLTSGANQHQKPEPKLVELCIK